MNVAKREAKETLNWLAIIHESSLCSSEQISNLEKEYDEIVAILVTSVQSALKKRK